MLQAGLRTPKAAPRMPHAASRAPNAGHRMPHAASRKPQALFPMKFIIFIPSAKYYII